jgi:hypothetical protein
MEKVVVAVVCDRRWFSGMKNPLRGKSTTAADCRYRRELAIPDKFLPHRRDPPAPQQLVQLLLRASLAVGRNLVEFNWHRVFLIYFLNFSAFSFPLYPKNPLRSHSTRLWPAAASATLISSLSSLLAGCSLLD